VIVAGNCCCRRPVDKNLSFVECEFADDNFEKEMCLENDISITARHRHLPVWPRNERGCGFWNRLRSQRWPKQWGCVAALRWCFCLRACSNADRPLGRTFVKTVRQASACRAAV
jgi:hypothetical protein